ncbi:hypothetical protein L7F22_057571 [Adiantum nelumboides]|nr:hypothetical protein [Adiantum nelumboides]
MSRIWPEKTARRRSAIEQRMEDVVNSPEVVAKSMDEWLQEEPVRGQESQDREGSGGLGPSSGLWQAWWAGPCEQITGWTESYTCLCQDNPDQEQSNIAGQEGDSLKEVWVKEEQLKFSVGFESCKIQDKSTNGTANEKFDEKRKMMTALETELEKERNAVAIATNKTMAMISRLQEEKSAMQLVVAQLQRMTEEKAEYDEHAMALLKEILLWRRTL